MEDSAIKFHLRTSDSFETDGMSWAEFLILSSRGGVTYKEY